MRLREARDEAGDGDRGLADMEGLRPRVVEVDDHLLHLLGPPGGNGEEAVEQRRLTLGGVHEQEPAAGGTRQRALGDGSRERGRDARVDRIAATLEHGGAGLGGQRMPGGDRALHAERVRARPGLLGTQERRKLGVT